MRLRCELISGEFLTLFLFRNGASQGLGEKQGRELRRGGSERDGGRSHMQCEGAGNGVSITPGRGRREVGSLKPRKLLSPR